MIVMEWMILACAAVVMAGVFAIILEEGKR
jgi:hypothetical protein